MSKALWAVIANTGQLMAIKSVNDERACLALFSSPFKAEAWILGMGLEQHLPSTPLTPKRLKKMLNDCMEDGFGLVALDPPAEDYGFFACAPIEKLMSQVEERV